MWYLLEGSCRLGERELHAGVLVYPADPHEEQAMVTDEGCTMLFVQYPGPNTGAAPIYAKRFDADADADTADKDLNLERW
ncbi:MAG: hypothetical protein ACI8W7_004481 [Gammaproteobacteria bacterium]